MMKKWVLLADDEPDLREMIRSYIELNYGDDVRVVEASNGLEATSKLRFQAFNCIITDINMPKKDGWQFIHDARRSAFNEHTPIVIVSGFASQTPIEEDHVTVLHKPFRSQALIEILDKQFRLGRTDQRIAADLLNTFLNSTLLFLDKAASLESEQLEPYMMSAEQSDAATANQLLRLRIGKTSNQFLIKFSPELLKVLGDNTNISDPKTLMRSTAQAIVKFSIRDLKEKNVTIESNAPASEQSMKQINRSPGVVLPVKTEFGNLEVVAIWEKKKKASAAVASAA